MRNFDLHNYDDIINLPHHVSPRHKPMKIADRAAQFGSFAALTGHDAAIAETGRLTSQRHELTEQVMQFLDARLQIIKDKLEYLPEITVTYFKPDKQKSGGEYVEYTGNIRRIDDVYKCIIFQDETEISIDMIYNIESEEIDFGDEFEYF